MILGCIAKRKWEQMAPISSSCPLGGSPRCLSSAFTMNMYMRSKSQTSSKRRGPYLPYLRMSRMPLLYPQNYVSSSAVLSSFEVGMRLHVLPLNLKRSGEGGQ